MKRRGCLRRIRRKIVTRRRYRRHRGIARPMQRAGGIDQLPKEMVEKLDQVGGLPWLVAKVGMRVRELREMSNRIKNK